VPGSDDPENGSPPLGEPEDGSPPLGGITVLDLSSVGPAARCTRLLADFGAQVVKIGPVPGRGPAATDPPFFSYAGGRGYKHAKLDVRDDQGREAFLALAEKADVVIESFRPGVVARLGIGYEQVAARNPRIVYCSTSGYGQDGPSASWAGHDLDYLAVSGYLTMSAPTTGVVPPLPGATIADAAAGGMHAALSIMSALLARHVSGKGRYLDVAVSDGALWLMSLSVDEFLATGASVAPGHDVLSGRYACYANYQAADGRFIAVAAIEPKFFANLCRALGCDGWIEHQYDDAHQGDIRADLAASFARRDRDSWVEELAGADTCVAPVLDPSEATSNPQYVHRGAFVVAEHPTAGRFRQVGPVLAGMPRIEEPVVLPDPGFTHTVEILRAAGISQTQVAEMQAEGVLA
jgi:alpha-methylacyl-CoA racemase